MNANRIQSAALAGLLALFAFVLPSCHIIGGIFKAGLVVGVVIVALVIALIFWIMRKIGGPRNP